MRVAALDISTKRIGFAGPDGELGSISAQAGAGDPYRRLHELSRTVENCMRAGGAPPDVVAIEDYALGAPGRLSLLRLGEVGGVIRTRLWELDCTLVLISPGTVKLFATGDGKAKKPAMIARALELGAGRLNDDEADAYHLRRMVLARFGLLEALHYPLLHRETAALEAVRWPR